jgi:hypothetical protein
MSSDEALDDDQPNRYRNRCGIVDSARDPHDCAAEQIGPVTAAARVPGEVEPRSLGWQCAG